MESSRNLRLNLDRALADIKYSKIEQFSIEFGLYIRRIINPYITDLNPKVLRIKNAIDEYDNYSKTMVPKKFGQMPTPEYTQQKTILNKKRGNIQELLSRVNIDKDIQCYLAYKNGIQDKLCGSAYGKKLIEKDKKLLEFKQQINNIIQGLNLGELENDSQFKPDFDKIKDIEKTINGYIDETEKFKSSYYDIVSINEFNKRFKKYGSNEKIRSNLWALAIISILIIIIISLIDWATDTYYPEYKYYISIPLYTLVIFVSCYFVYRPKK